MEGMERVLEWIHFLRLFLVFGCLLTRLSRWSGERRRCTLPRRLQRFGLSRRCWDVELQCSGVVVFWIGQCLRTAHPRAIGTVGVIVICRSRAAAPASAQAARVWVLRGPRSDGAVRAWSAATATTEAARVRVRRGSSDAGAARGWSVVGGAHLLDGGCRQPAAAASVAAEPELPPSAAG